MRLIQQGSFPKNPVTAYDLVGASLQGKIKSMEGCDHPVCISRYGEILYNVVSYEKASDLKKKIQVLLRIAYGD